MKQSGYREMIIALVLVSALVMGSLMIFASNPTKIRTRDSSVSNGFIPVKERTRDIDPEFLDTENEEGNDFVAISTPLTAGVEDAIFEGYIGEINVQFSVDIKSAASGMVSSSSSLLNITSMGFADKKA